MSSSKQSVLHCNALHWTAQHRTALHCTSLYRPALHCIALNCTAPHCTSLHCTVPRCTAPHCTALHCTALHRTALNCTTVRYTVLHHNAYLVHPLASASPITKLVPNDRIWICHTGLFKEIFTLICFNKYECMVDFVNLTKKNVEKRGISWLI